MKNLNKVGKSKIRIVDSDSNSGLELLCCVKYNPSDPRILNQCRGVVFNQNKIVMKGFATPP